MWLGFLRLCWASLLVLATRIPFLQSQKLQTQWVSQPVWEKLIAYLETDKHLATSTIRPPSTFKPLNNSSKPLSQYRAPTIAVATSLADEFSATAKATTQEKGSRVERFSILCGCGCGQGKDKAKSPYILFSYLILFVSLVTGFESRTESYVMACKDVAIIWHLVLWVCFWGCPWTLPLDFALQMLSTADEPLPAVNECALMQSFCKSISRSGCQ